MLGTSNIEHLFHEFVFFLFDVLCGDYLVIKGDDSSIEGSNLLVPLCLTNVSQNNVWWITFCLLTNVAFVDTNW